MRHYAYDDAIRAAWKSYPVRVLGPRLSSCCSQATMLVQSMDSGFVTANCINCGTRASLTKPEFEQLQLWVSCPQCRKRMTAGVVLKNYGYSCVGCEIYVKLADLVPRWEDLS